MPSVLFVTWDGGGNVPPALEIAEELKRRGHDVRFLGHPQQREPIESRGFRFEQYQYARSWSVLHPRSGPTASLAYAAVFSDRGIGKDLVESTEREPADRVVIDGLLIGAISSASHAGLRYAILVHTFYSVMRDTLNRGPLGLIMRAKGMDPQRLYEAADRVLVTTLAALDPAAATSASSLVNYTGPVLPVVEQAAPSPEGIDPTILVSLSTTYIYRQREALQAILDAVKGLPLRAIVTTGPAVDPGDLNAPGNAEVHEFLPHAELMPVSSLVVGHGGHATTMLGLAHGLPLLILPMSTTFDQPTIGRVIEDHHAGRVLAKSSTAVEIRSAIEQLLGPGVHRSAARDLGERIRANRSAALAADLLSE